MLSAIHLSVPVHPGVCARGTGTARLWTSADGALELWALLSCLQDLQHTQFSWAELVLGFCRAGSEFFKVDLEEDRLMLWEHSLLSWQDPAEGSTWVDSFTPDLDFVAGDARLAESDWCMGTDPPACVRLWPHSRLRYVLPKAKLLTFLGTAGEQMANTKPLCDVGFPKAVQAALVVTADWEEQAGSTTFEARTCGHSSAPKQGMEGGKKRRAHRIREKDSPHSKH